MNRLTTMLFVAGLLHFAILSASALVPIVLDWKKALSSLEPFVRKLIWVHGAFIVLTIVGFGVLTVTNAARLADGSILARSVCGFIAAFWGARLLVQLFEFDVKTVVSSRFLRLCNHALTGVFAYFTLTYAFAALWPKA
jgi:hypothetical protein